MKDDGRLEAALAEARGSGSELRANCPFCADRTGKPDYRASLSYNTDSGAWLCHKCSARGWRFGRSDDDFPVIRERKSGTVGQPPGFFRLADDKSLALEPARRYLAKRLPRDRWDSVGVGACLAGEMEGRVVVPIRDREGHWIGHVGRTWITGHPRPYRYPKNFDRKSRLFNQGALDEATERPLLIVEGVFDALAIWLPEVDTPDAVALLGKPTEPQIEMLAASSRRLVVALDPDADGLGKWLAFWLRRLRLDRPDPQVGQIFLPPGRDPDELSLRQLLDAAEDSLVYGAQDL